MLAVVRKLQAIKAASEETQRLARALCDGKVSMVFDGY